MTQAIHPDGSDTAATWRRAGHARSWLLASPATLWLIALTLVPLALVLLASFWKTSLMGLSNEWTTESWERVLGARIYFELLFKTFRIAIATTLITLLLSYPMALLLANQRGARKALLIFVLFLPFWVGYVVRTFAWLPILGRGGVINQSLMALGLISEPLDWLLYNEFAVHLGLVYIYLLFMILPIYLSIERIDRALVEAAYDLYARPVAMLRHVLLPLSWPGVLSGCVMVFLLTFGAYVTPALLGGIKGTTFATVIATQFTTDRNWSLGSTLAFTMVVVVIAALMFAGRFIGLQAVFLQGKK